MGWYDVRMYRYNFVPSNVTRAVKRGTRRGVAAGLVPTATTNGTHAVGSYHSRNPGQAIDLGLPSWMVGTSRGRRRMVNFQRKEYNAWRAGNRPQMVELIGPDNNMIVLRGVHSPLPEGSPLENMHDNHVHEAFA